MSAAPLLPRRVGDTPGPSSPRRTMVAAAALLLLGVVPLRASAQDPGTPPSAPALAGRLDLLALGAEDRLPVAFALVRLIPAAATGARATEAVRQGVTSAAGRYRFDELPAGTYRVQVARIGFVPVLSPVIEVHAGATLSFEMPVTTRAIQLAAVTVVAEGERCIGVAQLEEEPRLAEIWRQARAGLEIRREVERRYRYVRTWREEGTITWRLRGTRPQLRTATLVFEPDSADVREARRLARLREHGHVQGGLVTTPSEKDLLHAEAVADYCLEHAEDVERGLVGVRFRPRESGRDVATVRGTLWLHAESSLAVRLDFEYLHDRQTIGDGSIHYQDVLVTGQPLRLPTGGTLRMHRFFGAAGVLARHGQVTFTNHYGAFELVR